MFKTGKYALVGPLFNFIYTVYHVVLGLMTASWWLITVGFYYAILSAVRFAVLSAKGNSRAYAKFAGIMLIALSLPLAGTVILSIAEDRGNSFHEIAMITIAVYAFTKITLATVNLVKSKKSISYKLIALRNISFANALVSIFSLQRSMLVSFDGMNGTEIRIMNAATGTAVFVTVLFLGIALVRKNKRTIIDDLARK